MNVIISIFTLAVGISSALIVINSLVAKKSTRDREKPSPFECGFDPKSHSRVPFSLRFYLIAVIFLIFDAEITLIIPLPVIMMMSELKTFFAVSSFFILILVVGLYHEWNQGALNWK